eukprot:CAMPEP_0178747606 /NCGR_PEP_ID=MMETSP0744-20121128/8410_1 /TAXON_ID=913974 /ORGANISM="Nitzschia punctata, Strain CCMP561" /LENGTH=73 /DNA_ID=CAMNT_0020400851 /DNA_START=115 /DNA_END=333 /DNA_ORIENTATION=+
MIVSSERHAAANTEPITPRSMPANCSDSVKIIVAACHSSKSLSSKQQNPVNRNNGIAPRVRLASGSTRSRVLS